MKGLVPQPAGWYDNSDVVNAVSLGNPLPVQIPAGQGVSLRPPLEGKQAYSGTVPFNSSATLHGGAAGSPTLQSAVGYRRVYVYLRHRMQSGAQTGNRLRVRRRATRPDGTPWTTWTDYVDFTFDSTTTDATRWFVIASTEDAANPPADEYELTLQNASTTSGNGLVWQAVVVALP